MRTKLRLFAGFVAACVMLFIALPSMADDKPDALPPGMAKYVMVLWSPGTPLPDGHGHAKEVKEPDVEKLGGRVLAKWENRREILLPKAAAKHLRNDAAVVYLQRIWMGEPVDDWDERYEKHARLDVGADADTDIDWVRGIAYDGSGNITEFGGDQYAYDTAGRLLWAKVGDNVETYRYDEFGNLIEKKVTGSTAVNIPVDATTNRVVGIEYDMAGNVSRRNTFSTQYDALNMPYRFTTPIMSRRMLYDVDDEQIGMIVDNSSTSRWTLRDFAGRVIREYKGESAGMGLWLWEQDRVYADGRLVAGEIAEWQYDEDSFTYGGERHYHLDHLGSVRLVTDGEGRSVGEHDYFPFGVATTPTHQEQYNPYDGHSDGMRFAGHFRDFLGLLNVESTEYLDYMHARYYDPNMGRFLSVDPILGNPRAPQTWNRYTYAGNNPINLTDPTGMCEQKEGEPPCSDMEITVTADDVSDQEHYLWLQADTKETDEPFRGDPFSAHLFPNALWMSYQEKQQEKLVGHPVTPGSGAMMMMMMMMGGPPKAATVADDVATASTPARIYSARELNRRAGDSGPYHNFPESFNKTIFNGTRTVVSDTYVLYTHRGVLNGVTGTYEIGVRPAAGGRVEVITHRFFRKDKP